MAAKRPRLSPRRIKLGRSDIEVSSVCLGTMTFGSMSDEATAHEILDRYLALGGDFLDTAEMYPVPCKAEYVGSSEEIIGRWLAARPGVRAKCVIATKACGPRGAGDSASVKANREKTLDGTFDGDPLCSFSRDQIKRACDASLSRLGIETIDLYQLHWPERCVRASRPCRLVPQPPGPPPLHAAGGGAQPKAFAMHLWPCCCNSPTQLTNPRGTCDTSGSAQGATAEPRGRP